MSLLHMWLSYCLLTFGCYNLTKEAIYLDFCKTWMKQNFRLHEHRAPTFSSLLAHLPTQLCREWKTERCLLTQRWMNSDWQVNLLFLFQSPIKNLSAARGNKSKEFYLISHDATFTYTRHNSLERKKHTTQCVEPQTRLTIWVHLSWQSINTPGARTKNLQSQSTVAKKAHVTHII